VPFRSVLELLVSHFEEDDVRVLLDALESASAVSSTVSPPKYRSSTTWL